MTVHNISIAPLQAAQFDDVWQVFDAVAREKHYLASQQAPAIAQMREYLQGYIDKGQPYYVAVANGAVVGWCGVQPVHGHARAHVGMLGMGLLPAMRGQGLGAQLMPAAIGAAFAHGFTRIELTVRADNTRAIALYQRQGFVREGLLRQGFCVEGTCYDLHCMALLRAEWVQP